MSPQKRWTTPPREMAAPLISGGMTYVTDLPLAHAGNAVEIAGHFIVRKPGQPDVVYACVGDPSGTIWNWEVASYSGQPQRLAARLAALEAKAARAAAAPALQSILFYIGPGDATYSPLVAPTAPGQLALVVFDSGVHGDILYVSLRDNIGGLSWLELLRGVP